MTSRKNSSRDKRPKELQESPKIPEHPSLPANSIRRRLYLKDFGSFQAQSATWKQAIADEAGTQDDNMDSFKQLSMNPPPDSVRKHTDSSQKGDQGFLLKDDFFIEEEIYEIRKRDDDTTMGSESYSNQMLNEVMGELKRFIKKRDDRIEELERENEKMRLKLQKYESQQNNY